MDKDYTCVYCRKKFVRDDVVEFDGEYICIWCLDKIDKGEED